MAQNPIFAVSMKPFPVAAPVYYRFHTHYVVWDQQRQTPAVGHEDRHCSEWQERLRISQETTGLGFGRGAVPEDREAEARKSLEKKWLDVLMPRLAEARAFFLAAHAEVGRGWDLVANPRADTGYRLLTSHMPAWVEVVRFSSMVFWADHTAKEKLVGGATGSPDWLRNMSIKHFPTLSELDHMAACIESLWDFLHRPVRPFGRNTSSPTINTVCFLWEWLGCKKRRGSEDGALYLQTMIAGIVMVAEEMHGEALGRTFAGIQAIPETPINIPPSPPSTVEMRTISPQSNQRQFTRHDSVENWLSDTIIGSRKRPRTEDLTVPDMDRQPLSPEEEALADFEALFTNVLL